MHWLALLCSPGSAGAGTGVVAGTEAEAEGQTQALAWLALQFSPRVARLEDAVVLEVEASLRLFGGPRALHGRLRRAVEQAGLCLGEISGAPTSLGALALARAGRRNGLRTPLAPLLDSLPLSTLSAVHEHAAMLARLGCRQLADVRRLPRPALARRFGPALLVALDQAYGDAPEAHDWLALPEQFQLRLELPYRVEQAPALLHYVQVLLRQLCGWLAARHAGIKELTLAWQFDAMRSRDSGLGGELRIGTAETTRDFKHLSRLLAEHLAQVRLAAPAGELTLIADTIVPLDELSQSLLPASADQAREPLHQLLERLAVRLGPGRVREGRLQEDHRLDHMQRWQPWPVAERQAPVRAAPGPQPSWLLDPPQRLSTTAQDQPLYRGPLQYVAGPHRIEGGWWCSPLPGGPAGGQPQQRDYYLFRSAEAGLLWIYTERLSRLEHGWFLHGVFA